MNCFILQMLQKRVGNCEEELPKKPVGRLSAVCWLTNSRQSANCWPTDDQQSAVSRPTVDRQLADRFLGELFFTIITQKSNKEIVVMVGSRFSFACMTHLL